MLSPLVDPSLTLRRATGFQMKVQAHLLRSFTAFAEARGEPDHATPHLLTGICDTTERWIDKKAHHDPAGSPDHRFLA